MLINDLKFYGKNIFSRKLLLLRNKLPEENAPNAFFPLKATFSKREIKRYRPPGSLFSRPYLNFSVSFFSSHGKFFTFYVRSLNHETILAKSFTGCHFFTDAYVFTFLAEDSSVHRAGGNNSC